MSKPMSERIAELLDPASERMCWNCGHATAHSHGIDDDDGITFCVYDYDDDEVCRCQELHRVLAEVLTELEEARAMVGDVWAKREKFVCKKCGHQPVDPDDLEFSCCIGYECVNCDCEFKQATDEAASGGTDG